MKLIKKDIEPWIKSYATIVGSGVNTDTGLRTSNPSKYFIEVTQPKIFEAYAIALSSFLVYDERLSERDIDILIDTYLDSGVSEGQCKSFTWSEFYKRKGQDFDLNTAITQSVSWKYPFLQNTNELYPGDGFFDIDQMESFIEIATSLYGDQEIEAFYVYMLTADFEDNRLYSGKLTGLTKLMEDKELRLTPSLIYPKDANWAINTDFDLAFTTIGGDNVLIDKLVQANRDKIFKIV